jgi:hypothetical protein
VASGVLLYEKPMGKETTVDGINSSEQKVTDLSVALKSATSRLTPIRLGVIANSDFTVETGFAAVTSSANSMHILVRDIGRHVDGLLNSAESLFADTDAAIALNVLESL